MVADPRAAAPRHKHPTAARRRAPGPSVETNGPKSSATVGGSSKDTLGPDATRATDARPSGRRRTTATIVSAVSADLVRQVRVEIMRLTPKLRDTLLLAASGQHSYEEIGRLLGIPLGTVKWRVAEARRIVGSRIDERR